MPVSEHAHQRYMQIVILVSNPVSYTHLDVYKRQVSLYLVITPLMSVRLYVIK